MIHIITKQSGWVFDREKLVYGVDYLSSSCKPHVQIDKKLQLDKRGLLPKNCFRVKSVTEGCHSIIAGQNITNNCLLFDGALVKGSLKNVLSINKELTTGEIITVSGSGVDKPLGLNVMIILKPKV